MQTSLNDFGYVGKDNKPLKVDGAYGPNTDHAFNTAWKNNEQVIKNNELAKARDKVAEAINNAYEPLMDDAETRKWNMSKADIEKTQNLLNDFGYTDWQGNKLKVDGILGPKTRGALEKHIQDGTPKQEVFDMQKLFNEIGITDKDGNTLKPDGKLGVKTDSATHNAVKQYGNVVEQQPVRGDVDKSITDQLRENLVYYNTSDKPYNMQMAKAGIEHIPEATTLELKSTDMQNKHIKEYENQNIADANALLLSVDNASEEVTDNSTPQNNYTGSQMLFETPDLAALDFAMRYNEESINYPTDIDPTATIRHGGMEFGSEIYSIETENGTMYGYTAPKLADGNSNTHSVSFTNINIPEGAEKYAYIHTHAATGRGFLSEPDENLISHYKAGYLVSPDGAIRKQYKGEEAASLLDDYAVYANKDSIAFKQDVAADFRRNYDQKRESTKEFHKAYTDLKNKLIWDLLKKNYNEVAPEEIVRQYINSDYSLEETIAALDKLSKK